MKSNSRNDQRMALSFYHLLTFYSIDATSRSNKSKNKQVELHNIKKLLHSKGSHQQNEKATYRAIENICKSNLIRDYYSKYIKNSYNSIEENSSIKNWAEDLNRHFSKKDLQMAKYIKGPEHH